MYITDMNWMQVEQYLETDDRCVVPLGSTEQHAYLSLSVDSILAQRVALEAAEPLGVPVYPVLAYGLAHTWSAYPGTVTLSTTTYLALVRDLLDSLKRAGFRRVLIVNGHGGNAPASSMLGEWIVDNPHCQVKWHNWWNAPQTWARVQVIDPQGSHASWMENFPWTRLSGVTLPDTQKPMADYTRMSVLNPQATREYLGDGNMGGFYQHPDDEMLGLWQVAVEETRHLLEEGWV
ncbi:MAG: creatininase family protein [Anaerolineae bacterium]